MVKENNQIKKHKLEQILELVLFSYTSLFLTNASAI